MYRGWRAGAGGRGGVQDRRFKFWYISHFLFQENVFDNNYYNNNYFPVFNWLTLRISFFSLFLNSCFRAWLFCMFHCFAPYQKYLIDHFLLSLSLSLPLSLSLTVSFLLASKFFFFYSYIFKCCSRLEMSFTASRNIKLIENIISEGIF